jgi:putative endonuclease
MEPTHRYPRLMGDALYYTYIMASRSLTLYIGITSQIELRVQQHKQAESEGFTTRYRCNRLVWFERFLYVEDAITREKQLKGWTRAKKIALIEKNNPTWIDFSEEWGKPIKLYQEP